MISSVIELMGRITEAIVSLISGLYGAYLILMVLLLVGTMPYILFRAMYKFSKKVESEI